MIGSSRDSMRDDRAEQQPHQPDLKEPLGKILPIETCTPEQQDRKYSRNVPFQTAEVRHGQNIERLTYEK
jgi:hypothetical protein